jgi:Arc/MetJ-type ribon-helix-helix transcriptional regulator
MANHQVSLPKYHSDILKELKKSFGLSASEAIRRGLELLQERMLKKQE